MEQGDVLIRLAVALGIGLIVGLERGWQQRDAAEGSRELGLRSFALIGLGGGALGVVSQPLGGAVFGLALLALVGLLAVAHGLAARDGADRGLTTEITAMTVFGLGGMAALDLTIPAVASAVVMTILLSGKPVLHRWLRSIAPGEMSAVLQMALITAVVLPILPNQGYGPYGVLNPYTIWWMVILVAGLSLVGHLASRLIGARRGVLLTAAFGGLASSTATALSLSRMAVNQPGLHRTLAAGVVMASIIMLPRMTLMVLAIAPALMPFLLVPVAAMTLCGALACALLVLTGTTEQGSRSTSAPAAAPFELGIAVKFGALLAVVQLVASALRDWVGDAGLYALAVIAGLADVDAMILSTGGMVGGSLPLQTAANVILLTAMVNTVAKAVIVAAVAGRRMAVAVTLSLLTSVLSGGMALWLTS
ncbi:MgtC/SapB family protein [Azospirillum griseum]|nr:MgtC/SapB family protein [Azospirillum griseum]